MNTTFEEIPIDLNGFCASGTTCSRGRVAFQWGVSLNYYRFRPVRESFYPPVILVPGLVSVMGNFRHLLIGLTEHFEVFYLETAEKGSSETLADYSYTIDALSKDLAGFLSLKKFMPGNYILMGYSLGATVVMHASKSLESSPALVVLGEPSASFDFPWWSKILARIAPPFYPIIRPGVLWYIKHFRVNTAEDEELYHIVRRALDSADPWKLCKTVLAIADYQVWPFLPYIASPVLLLGTSLDTLHPYEETLELTRKIKNCTLVDMETNLRNHSKAVSRVILEYLANSKKQTAQLLLKLSQF
jgi:pimeloyl-ACP methyl ester carboxylesterase